MMAWAAGIREVNGVDIHYLRTGGAKPPLVLLHGLTGSGACWTPLARAFERDFDVVMPDARGHGASSAPHRGYRYDDHAGDVVALIRELGLSTPVVIGHSMGGMTTAMVARLAPATIRGVVLVDPTFLSPERQREVFDSDVADQHRRLLDRQRHDVITQLRARHPRRSVEMIELLADARLRTQVRAFDVLAPPNPDYRELVNSIEVPILLVIGDAGVVTLETAQELRRLNSSVRIEQMEEAGHGMPYDQPERLAAVVGAFLREHR